MGTVVLVLLIAASGVLVVEFGLAAVAGLAAYRPGMDRFAHLTGLTPGRTLYRGLGLLALLGVAGVIGGAWWPPLALAGAGYFALLSGFTLVRQVQRGQRGWDLFAYALFLTSALVVVAVRAVGWPAAR